MTIHSDNRPNEKDVSYWLEEKSDSVLREACLLVDLFRKNAKSLPKDELKEASGLLSSLIADTTKIVAFAHEADQMWSYEWIDLMFHQGSERYIEFNQRITGEISIDVPPLKYPPSIHKSLELLDDIIITIRENEGDISYTRNRVLENSNELLKNKRKIAKSIGDSLKDLVDEQAVHVRIDWQEFCNQVLFIIQSGREKIIEEGEISIKSWA